MRLLMCHLQTFCSMLSFSTYPQFRFSNTKQWPCLFFSIRLELYFSALVHSLWTALDVFFLQWFRYRVIMPKTAKSDEYWRSRLRDYASGTKFGQGQRPPALSKWAKIIVSIDKCPMNGNLSKEMSVRFVKCNCGYHEVSLSLN